MPFIGPFANITNSPKKVKNRLVLLRVDVGIDPYVS